MIREEFMEVVGECKRFLHDVNTMCLKLGAAVSRLEAQQELSEDEEACMKWLKEVYEGIKGVRY